jgi:hypothetical protein
MAVCSATPVWRWDICGASDDTLARLVAHVEDKP